MLSGLSHDPLLRDIFTPLWLGATLYIPDPEDLWSPGQLAGWMQQQELSIVHLTPAHGTTPDRSYRQALLPPPLGILCFAPYAMPALAEMC